MTDLPTTETMTAWSKLIRLEQDLMSKLEAQLKAANLVPLRWYDVLLELSREDTCSLRPKLLEERLLLSQYNVSRLIDRMAKSGLVTVERLNEDKRAQVIKLTDTGKVMKEQVWALYGPFIQKNVGAKLSSEETRQFIQLLEKLQK